MAALRAVIFDYGEVLSQPANPEAHKEMLRAAAVPEEIFERAYWTWRLDYDRARLNGKTYWGQVAADAGTTFSPELVEHLIECDTRMWMDINQPMLAWARKLKQSGLYIGILSNMGEDVLRAMRRDFPWLAQFDSLTWSCELRVVKPEPEIYHDPLRKLNLEPAEALFLDNLAENVAGARAIGMRSVVFENVGQLEEELRALAPSLPLPRAAVNS